jgi:hypothetical protein
MMIKAIVAWVAITTGLNACARRAQVPEARAVNVQDSCPSQRPSSWPNSKLRMSLGRPDKMLGANTGMLIIDVRGDSINPDVRNAQVLLRSLAIQRDEYVTDSLIRMTLPPDRYFFRVRRIASQTVQDSIEVRNGYVDTVNVSLGRDILCLL